MVGGQFFDRDMGEVPKVGLIVLEADEERDVSFAFVTEQVDEAFGYGEDVVAVAVWEGQGRKAERLRGSSTWRSRGEHRRGRYRCERTRLAV